MTARKKQPDTKRYLSDLDHIAKLDSEQLRAQLKQVLSADIKCLDALTDDECRAVLKQRIHHGVVDSAVIDVPIVFQAKIASFVDERNSGVERLLELNIKEMDRYNQLRTNAERDLAQARADLSELNRKYDQQTGEVQGLHKQIDALRAEKAKLDNMISRAQQLANVEVQLEEAQKKLRDYDAVLAEEHKKYEDAKTRTARTADALNAEKKKVIGLEQYKAQADEMIKNLEGVVDGLREELSKTGEIKRELDDSRALYASLEEERQMLAARLDEFETHGTIAENHIEQLKEELASKKQEQEELQESYKKLEDEYKKAIARVDELSKQAEGYKSSSTALGSQLTTVRTKSDSQISSLELQLSDVKNSLVSERKRRRGWLGTSLVAASIAGLFFFANRDAESNVPINTPAPVVEEVPVEAIQYSNGEYIVWFGEDAYCMSIDKLNDMYERFEELEADGKVLSPAEKKRLFDENSKKYLKD